DGIRGDLVTGVQTCALPIFGGTDREGFDTLRGFDDLRFRAPNRALVQAEFYKDLNGWFGVFGFADVGTVAPSPRDFTSAQWRHRSEERRVGKDSESSARREA